MRVLSVVGNRPQFVKSAPISLALRASGIDEVVLHTGQHWDPAMSEVFFRELELAEPRYRLDLHTADVAAMRAPIGGAVAEVRPDWVIVMGDTNSTLAGTEAAAGAGVRVAHVEAGLRSFDLAMPEERNRIAVDRVSELLLCPDERSAAQLEAEGVAGRREVVGDVMADATRIFTPLARQNGSAPEDEYTVLTLHREANTEPARLRSLVAALNETQASFVFPVHPRTRRVLDEERIPLASTIRAIDPLGYLEMLALLVGAARVVTDSGGLQKEAYWLGKPCVTLRASTEWVDTVCIGANVLVDPADPRGLGAALAGAHFPADAPALYGDGYASERIAAALYASAS